MNTEEKLMYMFTAIHGERTGSCYIEFDLDDEDYGEVIGINLMKDGCLCRNVSKADILFDYVTRNIKEKSNEPRT